MYSAVNAISICIATKFTRVTIAFDSARGWNAIAAKEIATIAKAFVFFKEK